MPQSGPELIVSAGRCWSRIPGILLGCGNCSSRISHLSHDSPKGRRRQSANSLRSEVTTDCRAFCPSGPVVGRVSPSTPSVLDRTRTFGPASAAPGALGERRPTLEWAHDMGDTLWRWQPLEYYFIRGGLAGSGCLTGKPVHVLNLDTAVFISDTAPVERSAVGTTYRSRHKSGDGS